MGYARRVLVALLGVEAQFTAQCDSLCPLYRMATSSSSSIQLVQGNLVANPPKSPSSQHHPPPKQPPLYALYLLLLSRQ